MVGKVLLVLLLALIAVQLNAQDGDLNKLLSRCVDASDKSVDQVKEGSGVKSTNILLLPVKGLFSFYRTTVSEQISADCVFELSCSRFSAKSISMFGIFKGGLLTVDRLTRCHPLASEEAEPIYFNNMTGKVIDDPSGY